MNVDLKKFSFVQPYEKAWLPPFDSAFHQIRPGYLRKLYPSSKRAKRVYMGAVLEPRAKRRPIVEIAKLVDNRSLVELREQLDDAIKQMLYRAHCGDRKAILQHILCVRAAVDSLQSLAKHQPAKVRAEAETFWDWPLLLSLNPQDLNWAKQELKSLGVGTRSPLPTKPGQRVDRRNFWTRLATHALTACALNKWWVPALKAHCAGASRQRKTLKFWGTTAKATFYMLANGDEAIIQEWQNQCVKLSGPVTKQNFKDWWVAVKSCILDYWQNPEGNYIEALKQIGQTDTEEWRRRNLAIDRVEQALRSLVRPQ